jgi:enoyl-CoA hydratase/carnithine racemase
MAQQPQIEIPPPSPDDVLYEKREVYALVTLNRPVVLNAMNWSILRRLMAALERADEDADVKAVVLTGAGRAFCSGGDLQSTPPEDDLPTPSGMDVNMKIWRMPKPVIAAVRGYAVGQGHELAATCDLTIASEDAVFGELQIRHGFGPPVLMTPFIAGLKQAKEVLLLGERINAQDALRLGIVNRVVPAESLMGAADEMARKIAALPARTVQMNKLLVNRVHEIAGLQQALNYREDPLFAAMSDRGFRDDDPHLKVLRERGWEAFRESRDVLYRAADAQAEVQD